MAPTPSPVDLTSLYRKLGLDPPPPEVDPARDAANTWAIALSQQHVQEDRQALTAWLAISPKHIDYFVRAVDREISELEPLPEDQRHLELRLPRTERPLRKFIGELQSSPGRLEQFITDAARHFGAPRQNADPSLEQERDRNIRNQATRWLQELRASGDKRLQQKFRDWLTQPPEKTDYALAKALREEAANYGFIPPEK